jgi:hypothetical protein
MNRKKPKTNNDECRLVVIFCGCTLKLKEKTMMSVDSLLSSLGAQKEN